jgi:hypothetical protein
VRKMIDIYQIVVLIILKEEHILIKLNVVPPFLLTVFPRLVHHDNVNPGPRLLHAFAHTLNICARLWVIGRWVAVINEKDFHICLRGFFTSPTVNTNT